MPDQTSWQAFAGVVAVLIFLGGGATALRRLGFLGGAAAEKETPSPGNNAQRLVGLERGLADLRLHVAENYVRRDDYVTNESRVIGLLENHSVMLARLDERIGAMKGPDQ